MSNKQLPVIGAGVFILGLALLGFLTIGFAGALFSVAFVGGFV